MNSVFAITKEMSIMKTQKLRLKLTSTSKVIQFFFQLRNILKN